MKKRKSLGKFFLSILWNSRFEEQDFFFSDLEKKKIVPLNYCGLMPDSCGFLGISAESRWEKKNPLSNGVISFIGQY